MLDDTVFPVAFPVSTLEVVLVPFPPEVIRAGESALLPVRVVLLPDPGLPPFSLSLRLEEERRTSRRSLSLSDKRRRSRTSACAVGVTKF